MADKHSADPVENFETLWKILDERYCFFEYKEIDWDEVYQEYKQLIYEPINEYSLFWVLESMLVELKDGHTNLIAPFNTSRYWAWFEDFPPNYYEEILYNYLKDGYNEFGTICYCKLQNDQIGYIQYISFSEGLGEKDINQIFEYLEDCQGLILDIRNNTGGALSYSDRFAAHFFDKKTLTSYMLHKTGKGHVDFSTPYPIYISPSSGINWHKPTIVLTNQQCYSAANDFANKLRNLPHITTLGDRTGGGSGLPFTSEPPNGWSIRFSACPILDANMQHTEFGIDPDIEIAFTSEDYQQGKDTLIEEALRLLSAN
ncbi:MAG: S41 family peptidase [Tannerellaceae bacterium]|nr:S41 family peptidase [Tannerellaceae bacterium]MCD8264725.1 S41 family peptidase [Tannerellaceae bacterium]